MVVDDDGVDLDIGGDDAKPKTKMRSRTREAVTRVTCTFRVGSVTTEPYPDGIEDRWGAERPT